MGTAGMRGTAIPQGCNGWRSPPYAGLDGRLLRKVFWQSRDPRSRSQGPFSFGPGRLGQSPVRRSASRLDEKYAIWQNSVCISEDPVSALWVRVVSPGVIQEPGRKERNGIAPFRQEEALAV